IADDRVVAAAADDAFDRDQHVVAAAGALGQIEGGVGGGDAPVADVEAVAAIHVVGAGPAGQNVVARAAGERVGAIAAFQAVVLVVAGEGVVALAADEIFDAAQHVVLTVLAGGEIGGDVAAPGAGIA